MDEFFAKKNPEVYNLLKQRVGDMFHPYTGTPIYDDIIYDKDYSNRKGRYGKVVNMSPDRYIDEAYKGFSGITKTYGGEVSKDRMIKGRLADPSFGKIKDMVKNGEKLWIPYLNYGKNSQFSQEGLHRALALKELGIKEMPVMIANEGTKNGAKKVMSKALRFGGKILMGVDPWFTVSDMLKLQGAYPYTEKEYKQLLNNMGIQYKNGQFQL